MNAPSTSPRTPWQRLHAALMPDYNRRAATYWWSMVTLGTIAIFAALLQAALMPTAILLQVLAGTVLAIVAGFFPVRIPGIKNSFVAGEVFIFLLLLMHGTSAATLAAAGETFVGAFRSSKRWTSRIVSPAIAALAMGTAGHVMEWALHKASGRPGSTSGSTPCWSRWSSR
jgi:hypothetical protein